MSALLAAVAAACGADADGPDSAATTASPSTPTAPSVDDPTTTPPTTADAVVVTTTVGPTTTVTPAPASTVVANDSIDWQAQVSAVCDPYVAQLGPLLDNDGTPDSLDAQVAGLRTIDTDVDCGQVYATDDLVVAWNYNEDPGESGASRAVMIDPSTDQILTVVDLPNDVGVPVVSDETVYFPGQLGSTSLVIARATWEVTQTIDVGRGTGGSQTASDGIHIFVPTEDDRPPEIVVVDATTFEVVDTIEPIDVNSVEVLDGTLWVVSSHNVAQRFDLGDGDGA